MRSVAGFTLLGLLSFPVSAHAIDRVAIAQCISGLLNFGFRGSRDGQRGPTAPNIKQEPSQPVSRPNEFLRTPLRRQRIPVDLILRFQQSSSDEMVATLRSENIHIVLVAEDRSIDAGFETTPAQEAILKEIEGREGFLGLQFSTVAHTELVGGVVTSPFDRDVIILRLGFSESELKTTLIHEYIHYLNADRVGLTDPMKWGEIQVPSTLHTKLTAARNIETLQAAEKKTGLTFIDVVNGKSGDEQLRQAATQAFLENQLISLKSKVRLLIEEIEAYWISWEFYDEMGLAYDREAEKRSVLTYMRTVAQWISDNMQFLDVALRNAQRGGTSAGELRAAHLLEREVLTAADVFANDIPEVVPEMSEASRAVAEVFRKLLPH